MERIAFLIERTGQRVDCLLNPENLEITRRSGVRERRVGGHLLAGRGDSDHPLVCSGGGTTELVLNLLFDVSLRAPLTPVPERSAELTGTTQSSGDTLEDVRELTEPIWRLAEHATSELGQGEPRLARLIWGKAWNILGVVIAVSERFERFTSAGVPHRSWLRLAFRRVPDDAPAVEPVDSAPLGEAPSLIPAWLDQPEPAELPLLRESEPSAGATEPLYNIAAARGLPPSAWRTLAYLNNILDPLTVPVDRPLILSSAPATEL